MSRAVLVLHGCDLTARQTTIDHMRSFVRCRPEWKLVYQHVHAPLTPALRAVRFDAVIFNYCFLAMRGSHLFAAVRQKYSEIADWNCLRIAITMDDCAASHVLDQWLDDLRVQVIYSPLAEHRDVLYPRTSRGVEFRSALTAYVDHDKLRGLAAFARPMHERPIEIGTRVALRTPNYGRFGMQKGHVAEALAARAREAGLQIDISTNSSDDLLGNDWFKFLGNCRFTLGQKGGYGLNDPQGSIRAATLAYLTAHPQADFREVESACFPDLDGKRRFAAVSPRLFEAAAMRTAQILLRDDYLGLLEPWVHYVPLEADLSNLREVFEIVRQPKLAAEIAQRCYQTLIVEHDFSYRQFVDQVASDIDRFAPALASRPAASTLTATATAIERHLQTVQAIGRELAALGPALAMALGTVFYTFDDGELLSVFAGLVEMIEAHGLLWRSAVQLGAHKSQAVMSRLPAAVLLVNAVAAENKLPGLKACLALVRQGEATSRDFLPTRFCERLGPSNPQAEELYDSFIQGPEFLIQFGRYLQAMELEEAAAGLCPSRRVAVLNGYAMLFAALGDITQFEATAHRLAHDTTVELAQCAPAVRAAVANLCYTCQLRGDYTRALELLDRLGMLTERWPSPNQDARWGAAIERGSLLSLSGQPSAAATILAAAQVELLSGERASDFLAPIVAFELGACKQILGDVAGAGLLLEEGYNFALRRLDPADPGRLQAAFQRATNHWLSGRPAAAVEILRPVLVEQQQAFGPLHPLTAATHYVLGTRAQALNAHGDAADWLLWALAAQIQTLGAAHAMTQATLAHLATSRTHLGKPATGEQLLSEAAERSRSKNLHGAGHHEGYGCAA